MNNKDQQRERERIYIWFQEWDRWNLCAVLDIKTIIKKYFQQFYDETFDNLEKYIERHKAH